MSIAKLKLDESSKLSFNVEITGASGVPESRFIIEGADFNICFPCKQTNEGVVVEVQGLKNILSAGEYQARLEVILENKVYTPMRDTIEFEPTVEIQTKQKPIQSIRESVKVNKVVVHKVVDTIAESKLKAAKLIANSVGYQISLGESALEIVNNSLMKSQSLSAKSHDILTSMLDLAEQVGIEYDTTLIPSREIVVEEKNSTKSEEDDDGISDADLEDMIKHIKDWEDIIDAYDPEELAIVDAESGEVEDGDLTDDLKEDLNEVLSRAERIKARVRFARTAAKRDRKRMVALKRHSNSATLAHRARRLAINTMKTKLAKGRPMSSLSVAEKERIERVVSKRKNLIGRLAMKLTPRVKKIERDRLTHSSFTKAE